MLADKAAGGVAYSFSMIYAISTPEFHFLSGKRLRSLLTCICVLQGYNNLLRDIFEDAGFLKSQKAKERPDITTTSKTHDSLQKCNQVSSLERIQNHSRP